MRYIPSTKPSGPAYKTKKLLCGTSEYTEQKWMASDWVMLQSIGRYARVASRRVLGLTRLCRSLVEADW